MLRSQGLLEAIWGYLRSLESLVGVNQSNFGLSEVIESLVGDTLEHLGLPELIGVPGRGYLRSFGVT